MSKQLVCVGIQTNEGRLSENCCTLQFVYRIYTQGGKCDLTPCWENVEKPIKDLQGSWLNRGVQIE